MYLIKRRQIICLNGSDSINKKNSKSGPLQDLDIKLIKKEERYK